MLTFIYLILASQFLNRIIIHQYNKVEPLPTNDFPTYYFIHGNCCYYLNALTFINLPLEHQLLHWVSHQGNTDQLPCELNEFYVIKFAK